MRSSVLLVVVLCALALTNVIQPQSTPNCSIILDIPNVINSPQFAVLCRLSEGYDAPLSDYLNQTANMLCDTDCRCVMGASGRGGRCGIPVGQTQAFCLCDYNREPSTASLSGLPCTDAEGQYITALCPGAPIIGSFLDNACGRDCQCSHGYGNTDNHNCTSTNGDPNNSMKFCVCGGGLNLAKA